MNESKKRIKKKRRPVEQQPDRTYIPDPEGNMCQAYNLNDFEVALLERVAKNEHASFGNWYDIKDMLENDTIDLMLETTDAIMMGENSSFLPDFGLLLIALVPAIQELLKRRKEHYEQE